MQVKIEFYYLFCHLYLIDYHLEPNGVNTTTFDMLWPNGAVLHFTFCWSPEFLADWYSERYIHSFCNPKILEIKLTLLLCKFRVSYIYRVNTVTWPGQGHNIRARSFFNHIAPLPFINTWPSLVFDRFCSTVKLGSARLSQELSSRL